MRYRSLRSIVRVALAASLIAWNLPQKVSANWTDYLRSRPDTCFVHDMPWSWLDEASPISIETPEFSPNGAMSEHELCVRSAALHELQVQCDAAWSALNEAKQQAFQHAPRLFLGINRVRSMWNDALENTSLQLVAWSRSHEMLPVLEPASPYEAQQMSDMLAAAASKFVSAPWTNAAVDCIESESITDFRAHWSCNHWGQMCEWNKRPSLPYRSHPNVFVFTLAANEPENSSSLASQESPSDQQSVIASVEPSPSMALPIDESNAMFTHRWQVGVDPICPEIHAYPREMYWRTDISQCCPLSEDFQASTLAEAESEAIQSAASPSDRPPTLLAELDFESDPCGIKHCVQSFHSNTVLYDSQAMQAQEWMTAPMPNANSKLFDLSENQDDEDTSRCFQEYGWYAVRVADDWIRSEKWPKLAANNKVVKPAMLNSESPRRMFSREELMISTRLNADSLGMAQDLYASELPSMAADMADEMKQPAFDLQDLMTTLHYFGSKAIRLPLSESQRMAIQDQVVSLYSTNTNSRFNLSKNLAHQLRSMGMFLVDVAGKLENRAEAIEIAGRENNQR